MWPDSKLSNAPPTSLSARLDSPPASAGHATDDVLIPLLGRGITISQPIRKDQSGRTRHASKHSKARFKAPVLNCQSRIDL
jgi:hypothetical protein